VHGERRRPAGEHPRRHDLVWLHPGAICAVLLKPVEGRAAQAEAALASWLARGLPLVAARGEPSLPTAIALGLSRPPGAPVRRIAVRAALDTIARVSPPPLLAEALESAPPAWRAPLGALERDARSAGLALRVHGSLAWQHLSGEPYVGPASDVDLLVEPRDAAALARALAVLRLHAEGPPRLDGEVLLGGGGVAWRELAGGAAQVLVKRAASVALEPRARLLAMPGEEGP
jgi:phosphoribosyl-dephospho-CoA transferase